MSRAGYFFLLLLGGILFAVIFFGPLTEVADNTLIQNGVTGFDGEPPPCRPDRLGLVLTLKGKPSVCQATRNGYEWVPAPAQPARVVPASPAQVAPRPTPGGPEVCALPPGWLGEVRPNFYTLADGRTVAARCTERGWEAIR